MSGSTDTTRNGPSHRRTAPAGSPARRPAARGRTMVHLLLAALPLLLAGMVFSLRSGEAAIGATSTPSAYVPLQPYRRVDTRSGLGTERIDGTTLRVAVAGRDGVPANATAVAVTVVVTGGTGPGFLTAYPSGIARPNTSIINYERGLTYNTDAIVPLGTDGAFVVHTLTPAQVVIDVTGAFVPTGSATAGRFVGVAPDRIVDTRNGSALRPGERRTVKLPASVPADAVAAAVTLTSTAPNRAGFFTAWPNGNRPDTSTLNVPFADATRASTAIVPLGNRSFEVYASGGGELIVDLVGYFTGASAPSSTDGLFVPIDPVRKLDSRQSQMLARGETRAFSTEGRGVAVGSLAMIRPWSPGFATLYANGTRAPETSSINLADVPVIAAMAMSRTTSAGVSIYSSTHADYLFDQYGFFTAPHSAITEAVAPTTPNPPAGGDGNGCSVSPLLVPSCGIWFGASTNDRAGTYDYARGLAEYEAVARNTPDILHFYKNGSQRFPNRGEVAMAERPGLQRSLLFYNWKPSDSNWAAVARGSRDAEIDVISQSIKSYPHTIFLTIWHEAEDEVRDTPGSGRTPEDYAAMYRHVVSKLRANGVDNVVFVWTVMGFYGWRQFFDGMYPGHEYVDWIGYDPYSKDNLHANLYDLLNRNRPDIGWPGFYSWATQKAPGKPIVLTEWGIDVGSNGDPAGILRSTDPYELMRRFPMLKAMMYWNDVDQLNPRIDQTSAKGQALGQAYRELAAHPVFNAMTPNSAP
jgi:hypothetical protein